MESFPTRGSILAAGDLPPQVRRNELEILPSSRPGLRRANVPPGPSAPTIGLLNPTVGGSNHPQKRIRIDGVGGRPSSSSSYSSAADLNPSDASYYSGLGLAALSSNNNTMLPLRRSALNPPSVILTMGTDGISSFVSNGGNTRDVIGGADGVSARYE
jgi:hypothetical protein